MTARLGRIEAIDDPRPVISRLTVDEINRLKGDITRPEWLEYLLSALSAGGCLGMLAYLCLALLSLIGFWIFDIEAGDRKPFIDSIFALSVFAGLLVSAFVIHQCAFSSKYYRDEKTKLKQDLAAASAHTIEFDINRVVEIEEYEDEGAGFFLEIIDGRVLCLISQDLYEYASDIELEKDEKDRRSEFPQTRIRYRYAPHSGRCLDLVGCGEAMRPFGRVKTTRQFFKKDKKTGQRNYTGPEDGMIYEGPIEATLAGFRYKLMPPIEHPNARQSAGPP